MTRRAAPLPLLVALAGCGMEPAPEADLPELDFAEYVALVEPVLVEGCSNPSSCHGREDRPFSIYAPRAFRMNPADTYRSVPLTLEESRANYLRAVCFAAGEHGLPPLLLAKPLGEENGGMRHVGGVQWTGDADRDFRTVRDWVEGAGEDL